MIEKNEVAVFECELDSFDYAVRNNALNELKELFNTKKILTDEAGDFHYQMASFML